MGNQNVLIIFIDFLGLFLGTVQRKNRLIGSIEAVPATLSGQCYSQFSLYDIFFPLPEFKCKSLMGLAREVILSILWFFTITT